MVTVVQSLRRVTVATARVPIDNSLITQRRSRPSRAGEYRGRLLRAATACTARVEDFDFDCQGQNSPRSSMSFPLLPFPHAEETHFGTPHHTTTSCGATGTQGVTGQRLFQSCIGASLIV
jgi:hypothetical protein